MANEEIDVGKRIRERREMLGVSLRELARRTELTAAFLSQVERGQANTSLGSLRRIADALDVKMYYFLSEDDSSPPRRMPVVRATRRARLSSSDSVVEYELLTPDVAHKMEVIRGKAKPSSGNVVRHRRAASEEWIYVLSGALRVRLEMEEYTLGAGDTIYFDGLDLRAIECASPDEDVVWISVVTPPVF